jgi:heat shock protein HslJ
MNRYVKITALWLFIAAMLFACSSAPKFSDVVDKDWKLIAVRGPGNITFDRNKLVEEDFPDIFTLRFDQERVSGTGAPNQYFAPYTRTDNKQGISIQAVAQSQMAPLREPEYLKEQDFFAYLQNTTKWDMVKGDLELHSTDKDGAATVLVFIP